MAATHHVGIEAFLDDGTGAGFDYGLARYGRSALGALVEFGFDPLGLFGGEQARFRMGMDKVQACTTGQQVIDRNAPFSCECFYPLSRHFFYFIQVRHCYPAASGSVQPICAAHQG